MILSRRALTLGLLSVLAACGSDARFTVAKPPVVEKISISFASVEVRDVSLPSYASADEIHLQKPDGTLTSSGSALWADEPERAIALEVSSNLARMSGRRIASEPWPFEEPAVARLELRFTELLATTDGQFRASGQYFVAVTDGRRERSGLFDLNVPFDPAAGPTAIARARGQLILDLTTYVARNGLR